MYDIAPTIFPNSDTKNSIYNNPRYGPIFGTGFDIAIEYSCDSRNYTNFPQAYKDVLGKGYSIFKGDNNNYRFTPEEIEVFKLIK